MASKPASATLHHVACGLPISRCGPQPCHNSPPSCVLLVPFIGKLHRPPRAVLWQTDVRSMSVRSPMEAPSLRETILDVFLRHRIYNGLPRLISFEVTLALTTILTGIRTQRQAGFGCDRHIQLSFVMAYKRVDHRYSCGGRLNRCLN